MYLHAQEQHSWSHNARQEHTRLSAETPGLVGDIRERRHACQLEQQRTSGKQLRRQSTPCRKVWSAGIMEKSSDNFHNNFKLFKKCTSCKKFSPHSGSIKKITCFDLRSGLMLCIANLEVHTPLSTFAAVLTYKIKADPLPCIRSAICEATDTFPISSAAISHLDCPSYFI